MGNLSGKAAGLRTENERLYVAGLGKNSQQIFKKTIANQTKINKMDLYRQTANTGAFSALPERMSKKHIRQIAKEYGINIKGLSITIDKNEDLLRIPYSSRADPEKIGGITFFPNAFTSREEILRTLYHEKTHVEQFREYGVDFVQQNRAYFEKLAYDAEEAFISVLRETGALK